LLPFIKKPAYGQVVLVGHKFGLEIYRRDGNMRKGRLKLPKGRKMGVQRGATQSTRQGLWQNNLSIIITPNAYLKLIHFVTRHLAAVDGKVVT
jgi:hypothetical protein